MQRSNNMAKAIFPSPLATSGMLKDQSHIQIAVRDKGCISSRIFRFLAPFSFSSSFRFFRFFFALFRFLTFFSKDACSM